MKQTTQQREQGKERLIGSVCMCVIAMWCCCRPAGSLVCMVTAVKFEWKICVYRAPEFCFCLRDGIEIVLVWMLSCRSLFPTLIPSTPNIMWQTQYIKHLWPWYPGSDLQTSSPSVCFYQPELHQRSNTCQHFLNLWHHLSARTSSEVVLH